MKIKKILTLAFFILLFVILVVAVNNVPTGITKRDIVFIKKIYDSKKKYTSFKNQLKEIKAIQNAVLSIAPVNIGIQLKEEREPENLYKLKYGLCYDRSRTLEKILTFYGYKVRHVSIHSIVGTKFNTLITKQVPSHAITEVFTKNGWLMVDSNEQWLSLDKKNNPISARNLKASLEEKKGIDWSVNPAGEVYWKPMLVTYGLYSRHGNFYPPYIMFPDINFSDFLYNFIE